MKRDQELKKRIQEAMLLDRRVSTQRIEVSVKGGMVTLGGTVQTFNRKRAAEEIAASFDGCRGVLNELEVVPSRTLTDAEVAQHVRNALESHADVTKESITVSVSSGLVTLSGTAGSEWERTMAEDVANSALGVRGVHNLILVDLLEQVEDTVMCRDIQTALNFTRGLRNADVRVALAAGNAVLSGEVGELWQKETAEKVVRRFPVLRVRNDIVVKGRDHPAL